MRASVLPVLCGLLLLAAGYLFGSSKTAPLLRPAAAGATEMQAISGSWVTADETGRGLVVWTLKEGVVVEARAYELNADRIADAQGLRVANKRVLATTYLGPALEIGK